MPACHLGPWLTFHLGGWDGEGVQGFPFLSYFVDAMATPLWGATFCFREDPSLVVPCRRPSESGPPWSLALVPRPHGQQGWEQKGAQVKTP